MRRGLSRRFHVCAVLIMALVGRDIGLGWDLEVAIAAPGQTDIITYRVTLAADGYSDYDLPVSSFQARLLQSPSQCYLSVVVPELAAHASAISDRSAGTLALFQGRDSVETEVLTADVDAFRQYSGGRSSKGEITAYKQIAYSDVKARIFTGATYYAVGDGVTRYRIPPAPIFPGDIAIISGDVLTVSQISWSVSVTRSQMEISNA